MPEQPSESSSSSIAIIRQHCNNNKNNSSPGSKAKQSTEQKMPLNLATPTSSSRWKAEYRCLANSASSHSSPLTCCKCTAPTFTNNLLLLPLGSWDGLFRASSRDDNSTTGMDDESRSDNGEEEKKKRRDNRRKVPATQYNTTLLLYNNSLLDRQVGSALAAADAVANNSGGGGVNISANLEKLQKMIMELNGSSSSADAAFLSEGDVAGSKAEQTRTTTRRAIMSKSLSIFTSATQQRRRRNRPGGGRSDAADPASSSFTSSSTFCHLCNNRDFLNPDFFQTANSSEYEFGVAGAIQKRRERSYSIGY